MAQTKSETPILSRSLQNKSIVSRIVNQITDAIINGELKPGDKLPTETSLCATFEVGRNSIREAIKILEAYGVVYIKRPDGTFVNDRYSQKMLDPMLYGILLEKNSSDEIIQLRKVLDIGIMQQIMHTITPEQIAHMEGCLENLRNAVSKKDKNIDAVLNADIDFHMALTNASQNQLLLSMYSYVDRITIPSRKNAVKMVLAENDTDDFIRLHTEILTMIARMDFTGIEQTINEHYKFWKQVI